MDVVLVTGGAGFIGRHLVDSLLGDGHSVVVVDDLSTGRKTHVNANAHLEVVDITCQERLKAVVDRTRPKRIFHLAAQSTVAASVKNPRRDCEVNVLGTLNVLEAARRHGAQVLFTSTGGALYGDDAPLPTPETHGPAPKSPYGASKWAAEAYVRTWAAAHGLPHTILRLGNVYGPGQDPYGEAGVVAILSRALWMQERPTLYGYGEATRDYVHVADVVDALRAAVDIPGVFNISTAIETPVSRIWAILASGAANDTLNPILAPLRSGELKRSCMDDERTRRVLGWHAMIGVDKGVRETYRQLVAEFEAEQRRGGGVSRARPA